MKINLYKEKYNFSVFSYIHLLIKQTDLYIKQFSHVEGWQSGQMQRTVTPSSHDYVGSNPTPSTTCFPFLYNQYFLAFGVSCMRCIIFVEERELYA